MQPSKQPDLTNWSFHQEGENAELPEGQNPAAPPPAADPVTWTASEFIAHHKDPGWYAGIVGVLVLICIVIYLATKDLIAVVTISIVVILFLVISAAKPKQRTYTVDHGGISIDSKFFSFSEFKSFSVAYDGPIGSVNFTPLKRLMPELTVYFAPEDEQRILEVLAANLPVDERQEKRVDRLMRRLRF